MRSRNPGSRWLTVFLLAVLAVLVGGAPYDVRAGKVYYSRGSSIGRANLDGSNPETVLSGLGFAYGVSIDPQAGKLYWADVSTATIQRANLDGSNVETVLSGLGDILFLAVDPTGQKVYWTENAEGRIRRADLDGSNVEVIVTGIDPVGIALDVTGGKLYASDDSTSITIADLDGSNVEFMSGFHALHGGIDLDVADNRMYWVTLDEFFVLRQDLDGSNGELAFYSGLLFWPLDVAVDPGTGKIYMSDFSFDTGVWRVDVGAGSEAAENIVPGPDSYGIALLLEPFCGDDNVDPGEQCDDGNNVDGDGCESDCTLPEVVPATTPWTVALGVLLLLGGSAVVLRRGRSSLVPKYRIPAPEEGQMLSLMQRWRVPIRQTCRGAVLALLVPACSASALANIASLTVTPEAPACDEEVTLTVAGWMPDGCHVLTGFEQIWWEGDPALVAHVDHHVGVNCDQVITPYSHSESFGTQPIGSHSSLAYEYVTIVGGSNDGQTYYGDSVWAPFTVSCPPVPSPVENLLLEKDGVSLRFTWDETTCAETYRLFADATADGSFDTGLSSSAGPAVSIPLFTQWKFFLVGASNGCGDGPKR
jgi:cysteine-rich repeat protein